MLERSCHLPHLDERQLVLAIRRLADSLGYGAQASPLMGSGVDYLQSRPYLAGDAIKAIDWRVTARTGKPFVKEYQAHKRMPIYLVVDESDSMRTGAAGHTKYEWAIVLSGALALAGIGQLSPVGLMTCGAARGYAALREHPSLGQGQVYQWAKKLRERPGPAGGEPIQTALAATLRQIAAAGTERSLVMILSDGYEPEAGQAIKRLAQRHEVVMLKLQDPAERGATGGGIYRAGEAETGRGFITTGSARYAPDAQLRQELRGAGVDVHVIHIEENFVPALRRFLKQRL